MMTQGQLINPLMIWLVMRDEKLLLLSGCFSDLESLKNLEMSGNWKMSPKRQGKVREFRENGKSGEGIFKILNCRSNVLHSYDFSYCQECQRSD